MSAKITKITWGPLGVGLLLLLLCAACEGAPLADGVPDDLSCSTCHGGPESSAPPSALSGETATEAIGVGAHQAHLQDGAIRAALPCESCHVVPAEIGAAGHVDPLPAEVSFEAGLDKATGQGTWDRTTATCSEVYCHGVTLAGGTTKTPVWTLVDGSQSQCGSCHGNPPVTPTHPAASQCHLCHRGTVAADGSIDVAGGMHIDGKLDVDGTACDSCHGGSGEPAPPLDLAGNTETTAPGVGAHREHLAASSWHRTMICDDCHLVPGQIDAAGHLDTPAPAELTWAGIAIADGAAPTYDRTTGACADAYCHGGTLKLGPGTVPAPVWTVVDDSQDACGACHGVPPGGSHPPVSPTECGSCHPWSGLTPDDPATHIDGKVDLASMACDACHGGGGVAAPPLDLSGNVAKSEPGVGAHREHLASSVWHRTMACDDCHLVPQAVGDPGHLDTPPPAELTWAGIAVAGGAAPVYDPVTGRCSDTYCHGATLPTGPGTVPAPTWTTVDGSQDACGTCHGLPPGGVHPTLQSFECGPCHTFNGLNPADPTTHVDGKIDVLYCDGCHGFPPATGAHPLHVGDADATSWASYGGLLHAADVRAGAATYLFDCGQCHPRDVARHADGTVDVEVGSTGVPGGTLRSLSTPTASYTGGVCREVYCHSTGQETPAYVDSPPWTGGFTGPRCASCHENPPSYASGGAGTATANTHLQIADDGVEYGHFGGLPGPWHTSYHGGGSPGDAASPLTCQTCHYDTVDPAAVGPGGFYWLNTSGSYERGSGHWMDCTRCHTGAGGAPAQGVGGVQPAAHVNGVRDVVFEQRTSIPAGTPGIPAAPNRPTYPTWVTAAPSAADRPPGSVVDGITWSVDLTLSTYDPADKSCQNVGCHILQSFGTGMAQYEPLQWGVTPVGWSTCNACHQN
ncbi:MAG: CxxxxCH/CxxCH domain-containing protein [Deltaproteobacteria bacterium]|nr:CxxxxCH/CxxCH domain-containing protein [Deltaproteobacteria bacterium]